MTERRVQMSSTIRKARRSHAVALKRRFGGGPPPNAGSQPPVPETSTSAAMDASTDPHFALVSESLVPPADRAAGFGADGIAAAATAAPQAAAISARSPDPMGMKLVDLASAYVRASRYDSDPSGSLSALQAALSRSEADGRSMESLLSGPASERQSGRGSAQSLSPAFLLCEALARSLLSPSGADEVRLDASRILTNLAATGGSGGAADDGGGGIHGHYGPCVDGWCDVILGSSAPAALVKAIDAFVDVASSPPSAATFSAAALCEQCCWALGNIAGDSQAARDAALSSGTVRSLVRALRTAFRWARNLSSSGGGDLQQFVGLCRNAAWALSNLARGATTSAGSFLAAGTSPQEVEKGGFTAWDLAEFLSAPEVLGVGRDAAAATANELHIDTIRGEATIPGSTWENVSTEICWILAFLTAREDAAVDFLMGGDDSSGGAALCGSLVQRLSKATEGAGSTDNTTSQLALRTCVPCIRAVGNAAAASDGAHVPRLLETGGVNFLSAPASLSRLIMLGSARGGDFSSVAAEAAWAAGAHLVDAGHPPPHSSTVACETLVPALCNAVAFGHTRLELKREAAAALCNAIMRPLSPGPSQHAVDSTLPVRQKILHSIAEAEGMINALTGLLLTFDADAVFASVRLIDAMLRWLGDNNPRLKRMFQEVSCLEALETVCDRVSGASSYGQEAWQGDQSSASERSAEIAADLIDDIFGDETVAREEAEQSFPVSTTSAPTEEMRYAFGTEAAGISTVGMFDFSGGSNAALGQVQSTGQGTGRGRGRGKVLPAWMQQQKS